MATVAKKKRKEITRKKVSEAKLWKLMDKALDDFKAASEERYERAMLVYNEQDANTQEALDRMIELLCSIARRRMWVGTGPQSDKVIAELPDQVIKQNMTYMAVEILIDLAQMDVQVENFKMPDNLCAICRTKIKPTKKKRKKR